MIPDWYFTYFNHGKDQKKPKILFKSFVYGAVKVDVKKGGPGSKESVSKASSLTLWHRGSPFHHPEPQLSPLLNGDQASSDIYRAYRFIV